MEYPQILRDSIDFTSDTEVCNIGFNEGVLNDGRPYRLEEWESFGITNVTLFISITNLEDKSEEYIKKLLEENEILRVIEDDIYITDVEDINENTFLSINVPIMDHDKILNECLVSLKPFDF